MLVHVQTSNTNIINTYSVVLKGSNDGKSIIWQLTILLNESQIVAWIFFLQINGLDDKKHEFQRISLTAITGQIAAGPKAYLAAKYSAYKDTLLNLTCVVESAVPFTLYWFKGSDKIAGPLFYR